VDADLEKLRLEGGAGECARVNALARAFLHVVVVWRDGVEREWLERAVERASAAEAMAEDLQKGQCYEDSTNLETGETEAPAFTDAGIHVL
jgi:hypothetical protein